MKAERPIWKPRKLSWKPRRRGVVYCAPACGRGCTIEEHDRAVKAAKKLAKLLGPDWEPHVWENLGWHYSVIRGGLKVHPNHDLDKKVYNYTAYLGDAGCKAGGIWAESAKTPRAAIRKVIARARREVDWKTAMIEEAVGS